VRSAAGGTTNTCRGDETGARALALRIDTHGERYARASTYEKSTEIVVNWLHVPNEYEQYAT